MFIVKIMAVLFALGLTHAEPPVSSNYGAPPAASYGAPSQSYGAPSGGHYNYAGAQGQGGHGSNDYENNEPKSYEFGYAVKDDYTGNDYGRKETSDGNAVRGEYRVNLPDGRVQIVTYYADWQTGFHADVRYEGTASYPDDYKTYGNSGVPSNQFGAQNANYAAPANNFVGQGSHGQFGGTHGGKYNNANYAGGYSSPAANYATSTGSYNKGAGSGGYNSINNQYGPPNTGYPSGGVHTQALIPHNNNNNFQNNNFGNRLNIPSTSYGTPAYH